MSRGVLPSSVPRNCVVLRGPGGNWVKIACANCGCDGGAVREECADFAFYLCQPCADVHSLEAGQLMVPDEVFWTKVADAQLEEHGRMLTLEEQLDQLRDPDSLLSRLARDRPKG